MDYNKLIWAIVGDLALFLKSALGDGMTDQEWVRFAIIGVGAFSVWLVPNTTLVKNLKTWVMALFAGLLILETVITGGVSLAEMFDILIAVLTTAGVMVLPKAPMYHVALSAGNHRDSSQVKRSTTL